MKNFFKKLSFVLAIAMVLTSIAPATASAAEVVPAKKVNVKVDGEKVDTINLTVGETETVKIGLPVKKAYAGQKSTFKTAAVAEGTAVEVVRVGNRTYELTAVEAGEATITFGAAKTKKLANAGEFKVSKEVKVVVEANATLTVEATGAQQLTVNFGKAVDTTAVALELKKGTVTVNLDDAAFSADKTSYVFNTTGKLTKGTYTVTVKGLAEEAVVASVDVENEYVDKIVLLDDGEYVAVDEDAYELYTYYDVFNQYGESVRNGSTVTWSSSAYDIKGDANTGKLTVKYDATDNKEGSFTYGSSVYIVGTYTKGTNVASVTGSVLAGLQAKADTVEFKGIAKVSTATMTDLPVDFKTNAYALLFKVYDQYGYEMEDMTEVAKLAQSITLTSNAPLLVAAPTVADDAIEGGLTVNGEVYCAVRLEAGDHAYKGGSADISAISSKTGTICNYTVSMGDAQILTSFTLGTPSDIVAEYENPTIPFTALDQNGEEITSFRALAGQVTLTGAQLREANDGSAYVKMINTVNTATETTDVPAVVTSVVVGSGDYSSVTIYVKDAAVPTTVYGLGGDVMNHIVESSDAVNGSVSFGISNFKAGLKYQDQYGRVFDWPTNNDDGTYADIAAYFGSDYGVKASYTGNAFILSGGYRNDTEGNTQVVSFDDANELTITTVSGSAATTTSGLVKFTIVEKNDADGDGERYEEVSGNAKAITFTSVDMSQFQWFMPITFKPGLDAANASASTMGILLGGLANGATAMIPTELYNVEVKNNGDTHYKTLLESAKVPGVFMLSVAGAAVTEASNAAIGKGTGVFIDQSATLADGSYKKLDVAVPYTITVMDPEQNNTTINTVNGTQTISIHDGSIVTSITTIDSVVDGAATVRATNGVITEATLLPFLATYGNVYGNTKNYWDNASGVNNQFTSADGIKISISKIGETENGLHDEGEAFAVVTNNATAIELNNVEIGDTFTATYSKGWASVSINFTVGADTTARCTSSNDIPAYR